MPKSLARPVGELTAHYGIDDESGDQRQPAARPAAGRRLSLMAPLAVRLCSGPDLRAVIEPFR